MERLATPAGLFGDLGGHKPWPIMHDDAFSGRLGRAGRCAYIRDPCIWASAPRFQGRDLRTLARWLAIQTLYGCGAPPRLLARADPDVRGGEEEFLAAARIARRGVLRTAW